MSAATVALADAVVAVATVVTVVVLAALDVALLVVLDVVVLAVLDAVVPAVVVARVPVGRVASGESARPARLIPRPGGRLDWGAPPQTLQALS